jgi:uncharacterized membrane protein
MKNNPVAIYVMVILISIVAWMTLPSLSGVELPVVNMSAMGSENAKARVEEIIEEGEVALGETVQRYQVARVELLEGDYKGIVMEMDYGRRQILSSNVYLRPGDQILVTVGARPDGILTVYFADFVRTRSILFLVLIFVVTILTLSRWKGLRSLLSMVLSLAIIIGYIIPHILAGEGPLRVSITGAIVLLMVTLYLTYGWNFKTHAAVLGMVIVLLFTGALAALFVYTTRLTGSGDENSLFLMQMLNTQINLRGLLLGGMIIGALGVLDDLVTTQSSAVFELHRINPSLGFGDLFRSVMRIGQDHVAATVNTLVLAYAGAALPMLLMFSLGRGNYGTFINFEFVAEEIVRTIVGSLGLIAAVPLTTAIATFFALRLESLGNWSRYLGPAESGEAHSHTH